MQLELLFRSLIPNHSRQDSLRLAGRNVPLHFVRHPRARRYVLRLHRDGSARVTVPRYGSLAEARQFLHKHLPWLEGQLVRQAAQPVLPAVWQLGTQILFRGEWVRLEMANAAGPGTQVRFATEVVSVLNAEVNLRPAVERHLWRLAARELPVCVREKALVHGLAVRRVSIRNKRSRWGSCSRSGTISLNWRLIQATPFVRDYIIVHELAHLREMNHSRRFWNEVGRMCPGYREAENWLKQHAGLLA